MIKINKPGSLPIRSIPNMSGETMAQLRVRIQHEVNHIIGSANSIDHLVSAGIHCLATSLGNTSGGRHALSECERVMEQEIRPAVERIKMLCKGTDLPDSGLPKVSRFESDRMTLSQMGAMAIHVRCWAEEVLKQI